MKKFFLIFPISFCFSFIAFNGVNAQEIDNQPFLNKVEEVKNREILYSKAIQQPIFDGLDVIDVENKVYFTFKGNERASDNIIFKGNNQYSNIEKLNNNQFKVYTTPQFFKEDNGQVREIIDETVSKAVFDQTEIKTTLEKILSILKTPYCLADPIYATSEDGYIYAQNSNWSTCRSGAGTNDLNSPWGTGELFATSRYTVSYFVIVRTFLAFDTSALSGTISSSSIYLYGKNTPTIANTSVITKATQGDTLTNGDFTQVEDDVFSNIINYSDFITNGYNIYQLNGSGTSSIDVDGTSYFAWRNKNFDVDNSTPIETDNEGATDFRAYPSEETGTSKDPYLIVIVEEEPEEPETPTVTDFSPCAIPDNNDILAITGCKNIYNSTTSSSTITAVEYFYFEIPAILYFFVFSVFCGALFIIYLIFYEFKEK